MAIPIIPILLAVSALGSGIVQGISATKQAKSESAAAEEALKEKINERAKDAKKLMQKQKTSFLKSGIYFDSGSPLAVINETYDTMAEDINAMAKDSDIKIKNLMRSGNTAFASSLLGGAVKGAGTFIGNSDGIDIGSIGDKLKNIFKMPSNKLVGGFDSVQYGNNSSIESV